MAILSDFDIFAQFLNSSGMPQSEHYASKSAGYSLYSMLWDYNRTFLPMESPKSEKPSEVIPPPGPEWVENSLGLIGLMSQYFSGSSNPRGYPKYRSDILAIRICLSLSDTIFRKESLSVSICHESCLYLS